MDLSLPIYPQEWHEILCLCRGGGDLGCCQDRSDLCRHSSPMENLPDGTVPVTWSLQALHTHVEHVWWMDYPVIHSSVCVFFLITDDMVKRQPCVWTVNDLLSVLYAFYSGDISVARDKGVKSTVPRLIFNLPPRFCLLISPPLLPPSLPDYRHQLIVLFTAFSPFLFFFPGRETSVNTANQERFLWCLRRRSTSSRWYNRAGHREIRWSPWSDPRGTCSVCSQLIIKRLQLVACNKDFQWLIFFFRWSFKVCVKDQAWHKCLCMLQVNCRFHTRWLNLNMGLVGRFARASAVLVCQDVRFSSVFLLVSEW